MMIQVARFAFKLNIHKCYHPWSFHGGAKNVQYAHYKYDINMIYVSYALAVVVICHLQRDVKHFLFARKVNIPNNPYGIFTYICHKRSKMWVNIPTLHGWYGYDGIYSLHSEDIVTDGRSCSNSPGKTFHNIYCWWKKSCTSSRVVYPTIFRVSYIPGG